MTNGLNLHQINEQLQALFDDGVDIETGEVLAEEELKRKLEEIPLKRTAKVLNCARYMNEHNAMAKAIKEQEIRLGKRRKKHEKAAGFLKKWIESACNSDERFEAPDIEVFFTKSERIEIREGSEDDVPEIFWVYPPAPERRLDKVGAKAFTKKHGDPPAGVELITSLNLRVK